MPTHDQVISNSTFPSVRADINSALAALFSLSSSTSAPSTTVAGLLWHDTANGIYKQRNAADSGWLHLWADDKQGFVDQSGSTIYAADSVGTDSYAITLVPAITAYATGQVFRLKVGTANTGAATLNVNAQGAVTIKKNYNSDLVTGDILANQIIEVVYDGINFQLLSPTSSSSSFSVPPYDSDDQTISNAGLLTLAHGLGVKPKIFQFFMVCRTAQYNWSVGDEIPIYAPGQASTSNTGFIAGIDTTNITVRFAPLTNPMIIYDKTSGVAQFATNANWRLIVRAYA